MLYIFRSSSQSLVHWALAVGAGRASPPACLPVGEHLTGFTWVKCSVPTSPVRIVNATEIFAKHWILKTFLDVFLKRFCSFMVYISPCSVWSLFLWKVRGLAQAPFLAPGWPVAPVSFLGKAVCPPSFPPSPLRVALAFCHTSCTYVCGSKTEAQPVLLGAASASRVSHRPSLRSQGVS